VSGFEGARAHEFAQGAAIAFVDAVAVIEVSLEFCHVGGDGIGRLSCDRGGAAELMERAGYSVFDVIVCLIYEINF
jgi:hypothetical protein